jgi:medium-chain acyl-[acyl-carrier-protein] hydrolase
MKGTSTNQWFSFLRVRPRAQLRLFCFPYAGGNSMMFRSWLNHLPESVELCAVQLPGRGVRLCEPQFTRITSLVTAVAEAMLPYCDKPFAFFGHSMGAIVSFELARHLRREHCPQPVQLFVSGRRAPHIPDTDEPTYNLPKAEFIEELRRIKGTPGEVLSNPELMQMILPTLRADFEACHTYECVPEEPLSGAIAGYGGLEDGEEDKRKIEAWREVTSGPFSLRMFPGGHFFLHTSESLFLRALSRDLHQTLSGLA